MGGTSHQTTTKPFLFARIGRLATAPEWVTVVPQLDRPSSESFKSISRPNGIDQPGKTRTKLGGLARDEADRRGSAYGTGDGDDRAGLTADTTDQVVAGRATTLISGWG